MACRVTATVISASAEPSSRLSEQEYDPVLLGMPARQAAAFARVPTRYGSFQCILKDTIFLPWYRTCGRS